MTSSSNISADVKNGLRLKKVNAKYFSFKWKSDSGESTSDKSLTTGDEVFDDNGKIGFFRSIKKKLSIKKLCKSKRKISTVELLKGIDEGASSERVPTADDKYEAEVNERVGMPPNDSEYQRDFRVNVSTDFLNNRENFIENDRNHNPQSVGTSETSSANVNSDNAERLNLSEVKEAVNSQEIDKNSEVHEEERGNLSNLSQELLKLSKYGWYWGPISGDEADAKLQSEPDGAFLIRDSSDDRYLLTLSFKSAGKLLHARVEHSGGMFSLCNQGDNGRFSSVPALIDHSMNFSKSAVFCYSRPRYPGYPAFPVRLTKPVSRFTQVRSLQYLCRFVIRQNTRLDNIHKLPLPKTIKGYIEEAHY